MKGTEKEEVCIVLTVCVQMSDGEVEEQQLSKSGSDEEDRVLLTINGKTYDVTDYAPVHPGEGHHGVYERSEQRCVLHSTQLLCLPRHLPGRLCWQGCDQGVCLLSQCIGGQCAFLIKIPFAEMGFFGFCCRRRTNRCRKSFLPKWIKRANGRRSCLSGAMTDFFIIQRARARDLAPTYL